MKCKELIENLSKLSDQNARVAVMDESGLIYFIKGVSEEYHPDTNDSTIWISVEEY